MAIESNTGLGEIIEKGRRLPIISIGTHSLGPEGVDKNEKDIRIASFGERRDVFGIPDGPRACCIGHNLDRGVEV